MSIQDVDRDLFRLLNQGFTDPFLDSFFPIFTDLHKFHLSWVVLGCVIVLLVFLLKKRVVPLFVGLVMSVAISDIICGQIIKPLVRRDRPEMAEALPILRTHSHSGFSFPSNHTSNMFASASFLSSVHPKFRLVYYLMAALVGYSRIYVGVHFPTDILGGLLVGLICGKTVYLIFQKLQSKFSTIL